MATQPVEATEMVSALTEAQPVQRLGVFGGTFDPVHLAHIELARRVIEQGRLGGLILLPCSRPPHREPAQATDRQRLDMLRLASSGLENVDICDYELTKPAVSFTVETLEYLVKIHADTQLVFCLGEDSLKSFTRWHRWQDILNIAHLAVMNRGSESGASRKSMSGSDVFAGRKIDSVDKMQKKSGQILQIEAPQAPVSASLIRERIRVCANDPKQPFERDPVLGTWLDPRVLEYIVETSLYQ